MWLYIVFYSGVWPPDASCGLLVPSVAAWCPLVHNDGSRRKSPRKARTPAASCRTTRAQPPSPGPSTKTLMLALLRDSQRLVEATAAECYQLRLVAIEAQAHPPVEHVSDARRPALCNPVQQVPREDRAATKRLRLLLPGLAWLASRLSRRLPQCRAFTEPTKPSLLLPGAVCVDVDADHYVLRDRNHGQPLLPGAVGIDVDADHHVLRDPAYGRLLRLGQDVVRLLGRRKGSLGVGQLGVDHVRQNMAPLVVLAAAAHRPARVAGCHPEPLRAAHSRRRRRRHVREPGAGRPAEEVVDLQAEPRVRVRLDVPCLAQAAETSPEAGHVIAPQARLQPTHRV